MGKRAAFLWMFLFPFVIGLPTGAAAEPHSFRLYELVDGAPGAHAVDLPSGAYYVAFKPRGYEKSNLSITRGATSLRQERDSNGLVTRVDWPQGRYVISFDKPSWVIITNAAQDADFVSSGDAEADVRDVFSLLIESPAGGSACVDVTSSGAAQVTLLHFRTGETEVREIQGNGTRFRIDDLDDPRHLEFRPLGEPVRIRATLDRNCEGENGAPAIGFEAAAAALLVAVLGCRRALRGRLGSAGHGSRQAAGTRKR